MHRKITYGQIAKAFVAVIVLVRLLKKNTITNFIDVPSIWNKVIVSSSIDDPFDVRGRLNVNGFSLIKLVGGLPTKDIAFLQVRIQSISEFVLKIYVNTGFYELKRTIDFENFEISNDYLVVRERNKNIGTYLLVNQIKEARKRGFKLMSVVATGGEGYMPKGKWNGHYTWARLGYTIDESSFKEDFEQWCDQHGRTERNIQDIISTPEGKKFWIEKGKTWPGLFSLENNSRNLKILQAYLKEKKIRAKL